MKTVPFYLLLYFPAILFGQSLKPATKELVKQIIQVNELQYKHVGVGGTTPEQYYTFLELRDNASFTELLSLLNHNNSVVKGYASWALADKKYPDLEKILVAFLDSKEKVKTLNGCIGSKDELSNEFYYRVLYQAYDNEISSDDSLFYVKQIKRMDSVILYYPGNSSLLEQALVHNRANPKTYSRIRQLSLQKKNDQAIIEFAKYKRTSDVESLKKLGKKSFLAISYFPDKNFWPFLEKYLPVEETLEFYLAIASFKSEPASLLLTNIFNQLYKQQKSEQIGNLDQALIQQYCLSYQQLLLDIWDKYKFIDLTITDRLIKDNPEKAANGFAIGLLNDKKFNFLEIDDNYGTEDSILPLMLNVIAKFQNDKLFDICKINIEKTKFLELEPFLNLIREKKIEGLSEILIAKLQVQEYSFDIFQLTETLLSFNNPIINSRVIEILRNYRPLWDEGNWSEQFQELFKQYNIKM